MTVYFKFIKQNDNVRPHSDIFVANNHGNQKYSESYQNDFNTWLKALGIEIYRYHPFLCLLLVKISTDNVYLNLTFVIF